MTAEQLLQQLQDIQPPPEPAWWLMAPAHGIALGLLAAVAAAVWLLLRYRRANRLVDLATAALRDISSGYRRDQDSRRLALQLSRWLRQVSLLAFPDRQPAGLCGRDWLQFLDESLDSSAFSRGHGRIFGSQIYAQQCNPDAAELTALCEQWLNAVRPRLRRQGSD